MSRQQLTAPSNTNGLNQPLEAPLLNLSYAVLAKHFKSDKYFELSNCIQPCLFQPFIVSYCNRRLHSDQLSDSLAQLCLHIRFNSHVDADKTEEDAASVNRS
jgi:hypothetical protein